MKIDTRLCKNILQCRRCGHKIVSDNIFTAMDCWCGGKLVNPAVVSYLFYAELNIKRSLYSVAYFDNPNSYAKIIETRLEKELNEIYDYYCIKEQRPQWVLKMMPIAKGQF